MLLQRKFECIIPKTQMSTIACRREWELDRQREQMELDFLMYRMRNSHALRGRRVVLRRTICEMLECTYSLAPVSGGCISVVSSHRLFRMDRTVRNGRAVKKLIFLEC